MDSVKMNQILAIEKGVKSKHHSEITQLHKLSDHPELFNGFSKRYESIDEDGVKFPDEEHAVQVSVNTVLESVIESIVELFDVTATKDIGNMGAVASVVLEDGTVVLEQVPCTFLLFLEKQLNDVVAFVSKLPILDPSEEWIVDKDSGLYKSKERKTHKTKKVEKPIVLAEATKEHPAQTQLITSDELIGYWNTIKLSGAISSTRKKQIVDRVNSLIKAVKFAREEANSVEVMKKNFGKRIMNYLFE